MSNGFLKREPHTALKSAMGRPAMGVPKTPAVHNASTSRLHLPPHQQILTKTGEIRNWEIDLADCTMHLGLTICNRQ